MCGTPTGKKVVSCPSMMTKSKTLSILFMFAMFCSGFKEVKLEMILSKNILFRYCNLENDLLRHDYFKS